MAEWRKVTEWWTSVPAVTRLVVFALPVLLVLDILFNVFGYLVNDAYATLLCYQSRPIGSLQTSHHCSGHSGAY